MPAWRQKAKVKEVAHSKFYLFDTGAIRAILGTVRDPLQNEERGFLLETMIFHELRAHINNASCGGKLYYWRTPSQTEIDFIWQRGVTAVGIEVKASTTWRSNSGSALKTLISEKKLTRGFGVYLGQQALKDGSIMVYPIAEFLKKMCEGEIIG